MDSTRRPGSGPRRLAWLSVGGLTVLFMGVELVRFVHPSLDTWPAHLALDVLALGSALAVLLLLVRHLNTECRKLAEENLELRALHDAALEVQGDLALDSLLRRVVDRATLILDGGLGAVSIVDESGRISHFVTVGVAEELRDDLPQLCGDGLIGLVRDEGRSVRLNDLSAHPRHAGVPDGHPRLESVVAVPVRCNGPYRGGIFVGRENGSDGFSAEDERVLTRFASLAAVAVDNAHLHQRLHSLAVLEERERIGREMHDGMAQLLAYVNTKAQAVRALIDRADTERARKHVDQLAHAARDAYEDARAAILDLRTEISPAHHLADELASYVERWNQVAGVTPHLDIEPGIVLPPPSEIQLVRIVQEALANVRKHADARRVDIRMRANGRQVVTEVRDDGRGFEAGQTRTGFPRFGLAVMKERAESVGGSITVESEPGAGTHVTVIMPGADAEG